jgi:hypothetical protein
MFLTNCLNFRHNPHSFPPQTFVDALKDFTKSIGKEKTAKTLDISLHTLVRILSGKYTPGKRLLKDIQVLLIEHAKIAGGTL